MASRSFRSATARGVLAGRSGARDERALRAANGLPLSSSTFRPAPVSDLASALIRWLAGFAESLAYSSGLASLVGGAMTWAVGRALASPSVSRDAALVACGAFVVYNVDRLRDFARDDSSSPRRCAFVAHNRSWIVAATALAALVLMALLATAPGASQALVVAIGAIGLLHRRLKRNVRVKIAYVAAAWTSACVGLPWLARVGASSAIGTIDATAGEGLAGLGWVWDWAPAWALAFVGAAVTANLIASNLREGKVGATAWEPQAALPLARGIAISAVAVAAIAPEGVAWLAWIPAAEALVLCSFRETERFGHLAVDGALLLGASIAACGARIP